MRVIREIAEMRQLRSSLASPVGLVPTMGYLHEGHLSLVEAARKENRSVVATIFVNPTQFGPQEDFQRYPRDEERDLNLLKAAGTDAVFIPTTSEMYPPDFDSWVDIGSVTARLEGAVRPGHFRGVTTVCAKLFNITQPNVAYFGEKDAQQVAVIKKMIGELNMNLAISVRPTVREPDGLALSSRNVYLSPEDRRAAPVLYRALSLARQQWASGEADGARLRRMMTEVIEQESRAQIDYISIADAVTLQELNIVKPPALVSLAVRFGGTRLIDNIML